MLNIDIITVDDISAIEAEVEWDELVYEGMDDIDSASVVSEYEAIADEVSSVIDELINADMFEYSLNIDALQDDLDKMIKDNADAEMIAEIEMEIAAIENQMGATGLLIESLAS